MKRLSVVIICFIFLATANSFAEQGLVSEVGTEMSHITYEEPGLMDEEGIMYGFSGSYTYRKQHYMLKAEGRFSFGEVDYDGQLDDGTPYTVEGIDDYMCEFRGLVGWDFTVFETSTLTPYIGLGYRYLNDDMSFDSAGYERESNYCYSPIGIETNTPIAAGWSIGITLEYDRFWKGIQKSHFSDIDAGLNDFENDQNTGYGCRGSMRFQKENGRIDFVIEPFIRYWSIDKSADASITYAGHYIGYAWEPENTSKEYGVRFAARF